MIAGAISRLGNVVRHLARRLELPDRRHDREAAGAGGEHGDGAEGARHRRRTAAPRARRVAGVDREVRRAGSTRRPRRRSRRSSRTASGWRPGGGRATRRRCRSSGRRSSRIRSSRWRTRGSARCYSNLGEDEQAREHIIKAYALKDRVSEPERLYITARYYTSAEPSPQKAIETYQIWNQTYPNDFVPHSNLALAYEGRGEYDKAVEEFRAAIALAPGRAAAAHQPRRRLSRRRASSTSRARRSRTRSVMASIRPAIRIPLYTVAFFKHDEAEMARQLEAARTVPGRVPDPQHRDQHRGRIKDSLRARDRTGGAAASRSQPRRPV